MSRHFMPAIILLIVSAAFFSLDNHTIAPENHTVQEDTLAASNKKYVDQIMRWLGDRADKPAEEVFKDIQMFKGRTAGDMIRIMDGAYRRSLGVGCAYCHDTQDWASNDKTEKQATRAMAEFTGAINNDLLPKVEGIKSEKPRVRCGTCHQGKPRPGADL